MPSTDDTNANTDDSEGDDEQRPFRDAEAWLAEKGIRREPLVVSGPADPPSPPAGSDGRSRSAPHADGAGESAPGSGAGDADTPSGREPARLEDQVSAAIAYARRATANTPLSEERLRSKMESRGYPPPVVTQAMQRARDERVVDDHAYAMALVEEGRGKGHAPLRIKTDMRKRDLSDDAIEAALGTIQDRDPEAQAFAVARDRARRLRNVDTETAYRRLVGYLARRGYTEALSRKVAREAVFNDREPQRTAER